MLNLNEVPVSSGSNEPLQLIPDGTVVRGVLMFQGGDQMMPEFSQSAMFFKKSAHTSAVWMPIEMTIVGGQFDKRKVWQNIFVHGDAIDEASGVSKARLIGLDTIRKIINSGHNLTATDMSPEAQAKRQINGVEELQGLEVCFVIGIEKSNDPHNMQTRTALKLSCHQTVGTLLLQMALEPRQRPHHCLLCRHRCNRL